MSKPTVQTRAKSGSTKAQARKRVTPAAPLGSSDHGRTAPKKSPKAAAETVRAKTLRLEPAFEVGLALLKGVLHMTVNKMVNEAVGEYIARRTAVIEAELTTTLKQLKAYRLADPSFSAERQAFIEGEALYGKHDPMEGRRVQVAPPASVGPAARFTSRAKAVSQEGARVQRATREPLRS